MAKKLILLIGAPGSGKTTDGKTVANECSANVTSYSLGEILKQEIKKGGAIGKIINDYVSKGELIPTSLTIDEVCKTILDAPTDLVMLDGFPREMEQVKIFGDVLNNFKRVEIISVIEVRVSEETARQRYFQNHDEDKEVFEHSLQVYLKTIEEIENFYKKDNILKVIDGEQGFEKVILDIKDHLRALVSTNPEA